MAARCKSPWLQSHFRLAALRGCVMTLAEFIAHIQNETPVDFAQTITVIFRKLPIWANCISQWKHRKRCGTKWRFMQNFCFCKVEWLNRKPNSSVFWWLLSRGCIRKPWRIRSSKYPPIYAARMERYWIWKNKHLKSSLTKTKARPKSQLLSRAPNYWPLSAYIPIQSNGINPALTTALQDRNKRKIHFKFPLFSRQNTPLS